MKTMIKRTVILGIASICAFATLADERASQALQSKLAGMQQFSADFTQEVTDPQGEQIHQASGKLVMARPDKLRWETAQPDDTLLVADGHAVWNVDTFVEQVTIVDQAEAINDNPIILLTTNNPRKWQQFSIAQPSADTFTITPVNGQGQIQQLELVFDNDVLSALSMQDAQEQTSALSFTNVKTDFTPALTLFEVTIGDHYTIDDQR